MIEVITNILTVIGGIVVFLTCIDLIFNLIPKFSNLKKIVWGSLANRYKHKALQKRAIASNIEDTVNKVVYDLNTELPKGWMNKAVIQWVHKENESEIKENEIILRIKPFESQDYNLLNGIYFFFSHSIFPSTKEVLPSNIKKAVALQISKRTISLKQPFLLTRFEKEYIDREITSDTSIASYFHKYEQLDKHGYFTGFALREIDKVAESARYHELRSSIDQEINEILNHVIKFQDNTPYHEDQDWYRVGPITKYGYLLVARPLHYGGVNPYLKRAKQHLDKGIERLYVMGCGQEKSFVKKVIHSISKMPEFHLLEIFCLHRDYRGEKNGIGALLVTQAFKTETEVQINEFFDRN